uniref:Bax inhibitor-1/YccA family protein n=1 Tax=Candidatus Aschnera chinzeii TaxID=1485666 RepID=A0AAT9G489_9ENTR|nr:MAG: Bax inhibitor-1/YccA family protein [Candidatus Aschnera chinzeii]
MNQFQHRNYSIIQRTSENVQNYMTQVYGWMTVGLLLTSFVALYALNNNNIVIYLGTHSATLIALIIAEIALVLGLSFLLPKLTASMATTMFMLYSSLTGLTISLVLVAYTGTSITSTFFITATMFAAMSFYGYVTKRSLNGLGNFLFMALIGITITSIVNIWLQQSTLTSIITYAGVLIFSGLTAYDTQKLRDLGQQIDSTSDQDQIRKHAIIGALTLYLDFINLFLMMLRIVGDRR